MDVRDSAGLPATATETRSLASLARWLGLALLALGLAVRVRQYLGCGSYWYDEAYLVLNVSGRSFAELFGPIDHQAVVPPLYLCLLRGVCLALGTGEWAMRLPSFLAGLAALLLMVPLARRVNCAAGLAWAVGWCAVSKHAVMHSWEAHPYAGDLMIAEAILFVAAAVLLPETSSRGRRACFALLFLAALFAPWFSFPGVFVLAGASLALFCQAWRSQSRRAWLGWGGMSSALLLSCVALWYFSARHLYYPGLQDYWSCGFPRHASVGGDVSWLVTALVGAGNYATNEMGVPLLILAAGGALVVARRLGPLSVLLVGPVGFGVAAAFLRRYPMNDRLLLFAAPSIWLLAAAAVGALLERLRGRGRWSAVVGCVLLLVPGLAHSVRDLYRVVPRAEFRGAFAHVHRLWEAGDALYVLHPEVYEVYFGKSEWVLGHGTPLDAVEAAARRRRLWVVCPPGHWMVAPILSRLKADGCVPHACRRLTGLDVLLYAPPGVCE